MHNGTKQRPQMYTIRNPLQHLRKLMLASKVERLSVWNAVHLVHFSPLLDYCPIWFFSKKKKKKSNLVHFSLFWSNSVHFGQFIPFNQFQSTSVHYGTLLSILVQISTSVHFSLIQSTLIYFLSTLVHSVHFGLFRSL